MKNKDKIKELEMKVTELQRKVSQLEGETLPRYMCYLNDENFIVKVEDIEQNCMTGIVVNNGVSDDVRVGSRRYDFYLPGFKDCDYNPKDYNPGETNNNLRISNTCTNCTYCSTVNIDLGQYDERSHTCERNKDIIFDTYENYICDKWKLRNK